MPALWYLSPTERPMKLHLSWHLNNLDWGIINYLMHCSAVRCLIHINYCEWADVTLRHPHTTSLPSPSLSEILPQPAAWWGFFLCSVFLDPRLRTVGKCRLMLRYFYLSFSFCEWWLLIHLQMSVLAVVLHTSCTALCVFCQEKFPPIYL